MLLVEGESARSYLKNSMKALFCTIVRVLRTYIEQFERRHVTARNEVRDPLLRAMEGHLLASSSFS